MRPVITISLNGNSYQLEQDGYEALKAYLATAEARLAANPDKAEILADLEQAIAEKCGRFLSPHKSVVTGAEVEQVIREMGPVDGSAGEPSSTEPGADGAETRPGAQSSPGAAPSDSAKGPAAPRRLYRIHEGAMIGGVCTGLAAFFDIDVTVVRVILVLVAIVTWGLGGLAYLLLMFIVPYARTSEQHAAAHGWAFNAEELIDRAKQHYAEFKDGRHWRRQWREERRAFKFQQRAWCAEARHRRRWQTLHTPPPAWEGAASDAGYASHIFGGLLVALVTLFGGLLFVALVLAIGSLAMTHAVLGWPLPAHVPLWGAIVFLVVVYWIVVSPLHLAHRATHYGPWGHAWSALWGAVIWAACLVFLAWLAWQHWRQVQHFLEQVPPALHRLGFGGRSPGTPV
ncbi:MAG: PspC domain-containing protein [Steroidobacteraceae bacterium]